MGAHRRQAELGLAKAQGTYHRYSPVKAQATIQSGADTSLNTVQRRQAQHSTRYSTLQWRQVQHSTRYSTLQWR